MEINTNKYRIYDWKHWMVVHWMLNPGLVVNELILGQRVPKVMLEDKTSPLPRHERSFVPCPHCDTLHDSRTWSYQNNTGFKNWFGLYCPSCGGIIPCLMNFTTFIVLAVTYPLWGWFKKPLKEHWLAKQPERFKDIDVTKIPDPFADKGWISSGISFGIIMYMIMVILFPLAAREEITLYNLAIGVPLYLIMGLLWGYWVKRFTGKRGRHQTRAKQ